MENKSDILREIRNLFEKPVWNIPVKEIRIILK
jgi:hypothetical protein